MTIFDKFKRKEKLKKEQIKEEQKIEKPQPERKEKSLKQSIAWKILKFPLVTEKSTNLAKDNQYTFVVWKKANKTEIKKAVEEKYNVKVEKVRILKVPAKRKRVGRTIGWKKGFKKAIVTIKKGQKIDILPT